MATWKKLKKRLPHNYASIVAERLTNKGFEVTPSYVSDVRRGRIKNFDTVEKVWVEIKLLSEEHTQKTSSLNKMKAA